MNEWVLCLAGIAVISVLCDLIVPEGTTAKYIKTIIGFLITVTMLVPLAQAFDNVKTLFTNEDELLQTAYLDSTSERRFELQCKEFVGLAKLRCGMDVDVERGENGIVVFVYTQKPDADLTLLSETACAVFGENVLIVRKSE